MLPCHSPRICIASTNFCLTRQVIVIDLRHGLLSPRFLPSFALSLCGVIPSLPPNMPPISGTHEPYTSPSWASAPYRARLRQRAVSLRDDSPSFRKQCGYIAFLQRSVTYMQHMSIASVDLNGGNGVRNLPKNLNRMSSNYAGIRRDSSALSDSSSSSSRASSSQFSTSTSASSFQALTDSPNSTSKSDAHLPFPLPLASQYTHLHDLSSAHPRRSSLGNVSRRPSISDRTGRVPPTMAEVLAPLQLDPTLANELEKEPPLTLPRPWDSEKEIAGYPRRDSQRIVELSRSRSRSPERLLHKLPPIIQTASVPADVPKAKFVDGLVGAACIAVEVVWKVPELRDVNGLPTPSVSPTSRSSAEQSGVLPLRHFIKEVLRRSRSTCSTLQTALYYIHKSRDLIRDRVRRSEDAKVELLRMKAAGQSWNVNSLPSPPHDGDTESVWMSSKTTAGLLAKTRDPVLCGRRMFLAALICASKFLQDRTYSNRAWAKISSLPEEEINANEKVFLELLDYNLFVNADLFKNCTCFPDNPIDR